MGFPQYIDPEFEKLLDEAEDEYYRQLDEQEQQPQPVIEQQQKQESNGNDESE